MEFTLNLQLLLSFNKIKPSKIGDSSELVRLQNLIIKAEKEKTRILGEIKLYKAALAGEFIRQGVDKDK